MKVYSVTGTATTSYISEQAQTFTLNVCAMGKTHACEIAARDMASRGYRGVIITSATPLPGLGSYMLGDTLLVR